jgi:hypothetical protein
LGKLEIGQFRHLTSFEVRQLKQVAAGMKPIGEVPLENSEAEAKPKSLKPKPLKSKSPTFRSPKPKTPESKAPAAESVEVRPPKRSRTAPRKPRT